MFRSVLAADPRHFGALGSLAQLKFQQGVPADGLTLIRRALQVRPDSPEALYAEGCLLQALGRPAEAMSSYARAIRLKPDFVAACSNLGGLYVEQRQYDAALPLYETVLAVRPDIWEAHNNLGVALLGLNRPEAALEHFVQAAELNPGVADVHGNRGSALMALGRLAEARLAFAEAVRLAPRNGKFYLDLVRCGRVTDDDKLLAAMEALAAEPAGSGSAAPGARLGTKPAVESRIELQFALAKALADLGRIEPSFRHLRHGNALKRASIAYHEAETLAMMQRLPVLFGRDRLDGRARAGDPSPLPVFVVGMPRSGTTLIEQILASHPLVFGAGERPDLHRAALEEAGPATQPAGLFDRLAVLPDGLLAQLGGRYVESLRALAPDATRIVDKMPGNFLYLGVIATALPNAKVIHVRRDPLDTCLSCFATLFSGHQPYAYNLAELGRYYRAYAALMAHWREVLPESMLLEVRYEDVVDDLAGQTRRMVAHCGLPWDERCLDFHATQRSVQTASKAQVRQALYRSSVGRAKHYGGLLAPLVEALGPAA